MEIAAGTSATGTQARWGCETDVPLVRHRALTPIRLCGGAASVCGSLVATVLILVWTAGAAHAQMYLPDPSIRADDTTNTYFGSTKDVDGRLLSDVTVAVTGDNATYVMVTDDAGRFKIRVPKTLPAARLKFSCSKPGYALVRVVRRSPPKGAASPVQADCVFAPKPAAAK